MVRRIYVEKKKEYANEEKSLLSDATLLLGVKGLTNIRIFNRYDAEDMDEELFNKAINTVFSEPPVDNTFNSLPIEGAKTFAVEYLPGQFDQRADSAMQCIQIISKGERPLIKTAKVYALYGDISVSDIEAIKKYVINPVEAREASFDLPETLSIKYNIPIDVEYLTGFRDLDDEGLSKFIAAKGLAMDLDDLRFCREYFNKEGRDPSITEIKVIDTYWSDHCRHTTFNTVIDSVCFHDPMVENEYEEYIALRAKLNRTKPISLMDIATISVKALKKEGKLAKLDESDEINACTVKIDVDVDGKKEPWLLLFKNETHNHPTEIEPFGGAATCIGGAIRDPLSGRSYVYAAMRVTGAADPLKNVADTVKGKLPQRKIVTAAAGGYSSYGNQIGLATGMVHEFYHPGYEAKRMEIGAVIAATPEENVIRKVPIAGDKVILLGGSTGRDGIGGATGSSKAHNLHSVENCGAEVQKGNAPEERKLQRLFRNEEAKKLIKRCNDFGAGGVSVAIGELAEGLNINLNAVPKKYEGLDGTELAISESQERMAVVTDKENVDKFLALCSEENLQAVEVATVTDDNRLKMNWNGNTIVDIDRAFLDTNGVSKHIDINVAAPNDSDKKHISDFREAYIGLLSDLNICSMRGLSERFDSTIGAGTVLMPFGGKYQLTPIEAMVHKISVESNETNTCSLMSYGFDPYLSAESPFKGAYTAVCSSIAKLIATGASFKDIYLSFQEYFEKPGTDSDSWGKPLSALLGAFKAQMELGVAAIGGKDSMSGTFEDLKVPPTLCSFAVTTTDIADICSNEFKKAGHRVVLMTADLDTDGLSSSASLIELFNTVSTLLREGKAVTAYTPEMGGIAEAVFKMAIGNMLGFRYDEGLDLDELFNKNYCSFILELRDDAKIPIGATLLGSITADKTISFKNESIDINDLLSYYEDKLESVYTCNIKDDRKAPETISFDGKMKTVNIVKCTKPKVIIPSFPGTNCEYDSKKAFDRAGADSEIYVVKNLSAADIKESVSEFAGLIRKSQIIFIPGGFSGGDEPDGSAKFITAFFRNAEVMDALADFLNHRGGLMCGICNGFQALIKLGLLPYGKITEPREDMPTLTFNTIARHQSKIVRTRVSSNMSPWLADTSVGDIYSVPISHGEGRFICEEKLLSELIKNGQVATQYVDLDGKPTYDIRYNPNGSIMAIEGITSPDGRIIGKMGHSERIDKGIYKNVPGDYDIKMFKSAVDFLSKL